MLKKLLLFMMLCVSAVGAWATDDVVLDFGTGSTWTINYSGGDAVTGVTINVATPGDLYTIKGDMAYGGSTYDMWHVEGKTVVITGTLNDNDVEVLTVNESPRWVAYAKASVLNLTEATLPDNAENTIKSAWSAQHSGSYSGLKFPGDDDNPGETPDDTRTIELRHGGELLGDVINVPLGSNFEFTVQGIGFQGDYLSTATINVGNTSLCTAVCPTIGNAKYSAQTVTVTPNLSSETGNTTITIILKGASDATEKSVVLTVNVYDPTVASSFSIYPASPITVDKGSSTDVEVRIEPSSATFELSAVTGLAGVTAEIVEVAGKKYIRINASEATETGTATFTLSPNGLSPVVVTVNVVAPRVPVTANCPETVRFGQNNLSASAVLEVEESEKDNYTVSYSSKNPSILNVNSETGVLTPVALGDATITVTVTPKNPDAEYAEFTRDFPVTVAKGQYTLTANADPAFFVVGEGGTSTLSYSNVQLNGVEATTGFSVAYSPKAPKDGVSVDGSVVTIAFTATTGTFTAVATLTPADTDNYEVATAEVDITIGTPGIALDIVDQTFGKSAGTQAVSGGLRIIDGDFTNDATYTFSASSSDESVVTVAWNGAVNQHNNSLNFTVNGVGEADVTLTVNGKASNGKTTSVTKKIKVTVSGDPISAEVTGTITVNYDQALSLDVIKSHVAVTANSTAITSGYDIEVYKDEEKIVTSIPAVDDLDVDFYDITIKVIATDPNYSGTVEVPATVTVTHLQSFTLTLDKTSATIKAGEVATITPSSKKKDAEEPVSVDYSATSSNTGVATAVVVDGKVKVTGVSDGSAIITVTATPTDASSYAVMKETVNITVSSTTDGTVTTTPSADGKTLTITCSGDVCNPNISFASAGYKFTAAAKDVVYSNKEGQKVAQGEIYNGGDYYTRVTQYNEDSNVPTKNVEAYKFVQGAVDAGIYKINWNTDPTTYDPVAVNDKLDEGTDWIVDANFSKYYTRETQYNYATIADMSSYLDTEDGTIFKSDLAANTVFSDQNGTAVTAGSDYTEGNSYYTRSENGYTYQHITLDALKTAAYTTTFTEKKLNIGTAEYYVEVAGDKVRVYNGADYDEHETYYLATSEYAAIENITSTAYLESATVANNYWEAMINTINAGQYKTIKLVSENKENPALICYHVTQALIASSCIEELDLSGVQIDEITSATNSGYAPIATGTFTNTHKNNSPNETLKVLHMPHIKNATKKDVPYKEGVRDHYHVPIYVAGQLYALEEVSLPDNCTCVETNAFGYSQNGTVKKLTMNNGLRFVGDKAFNSSDNFYSLVFPSSMEYIGNFAFSGGGINDVVFLGNEAPIVRMRAFSDKAYLNNNAIIDGNVLERDWYRITRDAYVSNTYMAAMLHLPQVYNKDTNPNGITLAQRAKYTDVTRDYHVFNWLPYNVEVDKDGLSLEEAYLKYTQAKEITDNGAGKWVLHFDEILPNDDKEQPFTDDNGTRMAYKCGTDVSGNLLSPSWGQGDDAGNGGAASEGNQPYVISQGGLSLKNDGVTWENGFNHHKYGMYDLHLGMQYVWPGQVYMNRAFNAASQGVLWDSKTTIHQGIVNAAGVSPAKGTAYDSNNTASYDTNCDGEDDIYFHDGEEYIGLHQFILVNYDIQGSKTDEWEFNTIGGANWWTICAPIDMTAAEVRATFGDKTQVCKFSDVSRREDRTLRSGTQIINDDKVKFYFCDEQCVGKADNEIAIHANVAYMIHPSNNLDGDHNKFVLPDFKVAPNSLPIPTTLKTYDKKEYDKEYEYTFIGNYNTNPKNGSYLFMPQYAYYLGNAGTVSGREQHKLFIQSGTTGTWKPYTAVILPSDGKADFDTFFGGSKAKAVSGMIGFDEFEDDLVDNIKYEYVFGAENAPKAVYNLNGQKVGNTASNLPSGIYVSEGKKFVVK